MASIFSGNYYDSSVDETSRCKKNCLMPSVKVTKTALKIKTNRLPNTRQSLI